MDRKNNEMKTNMSDLNMYSVARIVMAEKIREVRQNDPWLLPMFCEVYFGLCRMEAIALYWRTKETVEFTLIPEHILQAEREVSNWMAEHGIKKWELGGCRSR